jgi:hypothetical protein
LKSAALACAGKLRPRIHARPPLSEATRAHEIAEPLASSCAGAASARDRVAPFRRAHRI